MKTPAVLAIAILLMAAAAAGQANRVVPGHVAGEVSRVSQPSPAAARQLTPSKVVTAFLMGNPGSRRFLWEGSKDATAAASTVAASTLTTDARRPAASL